MYLLLNSQSAVSQYFSSCIFFVYIRNVSRFSGGFNTVFLLLKEGLECGARKVGMRDDVLEAFRRVLARPRKSNVSIDGYSNFLFLSRTGNPRTAIDYQTILRRIREKHAKKYGPILPENMTPHTMRHTFCTKMALSGMNPKSLQYIMGHADIKITMNYCAPFFRLQSRHSIWQLSGVVCPPLDHAVIWSACISSKSNSSPQMAHLWPCRS